MRRLIWISLAFALTIFQFWAVLAPGPVPINNHPIRLMLTLVLFWGSALGGLWMLFMIIRHEKRVFPIILVPLCIPNSFLWYYFERVMTRRNAAGTSQSEAVRN